MTLKYLKAKVNDPKKIYLYRDENEDKYLNKEIEKLKCRLCMYI